MLQGRMGRMVGLSVLSISTGFFQVRPEAGPHGTESLRGPAAPRTADHLENPGLAAAPLRPVHARSLPPGSSGRNYLTSPARGQKLLDFPTAVPQQPLQVQHARTRLA